jgi:signal peptidase I
MLFPVSIMRVQGESMSPLLNANSSPDEPSSPADWVIVRKVHIPEFPSWLFRRPQKKMTLERGQVVVYYAPHNPDTFVIKRVIALPGDRVRPLEGYPGGDDKPVIIPYNHIWVEGDANSRKKSVDSNHFGPISQNMVCGCVLAVYSPWSNRPVQLKWEMDDYPAKNSGRVEKDVVGTAKLDPDVADWQNGNVFKDGRAALELAAIRKGLLRPEQMRNKDTLHYFRKLYARAQSEAANGDTVTKEVARQLADELELIFETAGLSRNGGRPVPVLSDKQAEQDAVAAAAATLKRERREAYLAKHRPAEQSTPVESTATSSG